MGMQSLFLPTSDAIRNPEAVQESLESYALQETSCPPWPLLDLCPKTCQERARAVTPSAHKGLRPHGEGLSRAPAGLGRKLLTTRAACSTAHILATQGEERDQISPESAQGYPVV